MSLLYHLYVILLSFLSHTPICWLVKTRIRVKCLMWHTFLTPYTHFDHRYVSSDFGNHPLSHLMASVWALHDRSRVEVSG